MKHKINRRKPRSIRTKLILMFTLITAGALVLLLIFQMFFIEFFYRTMKMYGIESASAQIAQAIGTDELGEYMGYWHTKEQLDIFVVAEDGRVLYKEVGGVDANRFGEKELREFFDKAEENGGRYVTENAVSLKAPPKDPDKGGNKPPKGESPAKPKSADGNEVFERVYHAKIVVKDSSDAGCMVLISAHLTPVSSTVRTLIVQFVIAVLVVIAFATVISHSIAKRIARPITAINEAAKRLADGEYVPPENGGFLEAEELSLTLAKASQELKRTERLQRELLANVSHDLRTPLTMITGYSEAVRDFPGEDVAENIQVVIDEANHLNRLVNDVLDLSKLQSGTRQLVFEPVELTSIIGDVVSRCRRLSCGSCDITFEHDAEVVVTGDELRISQVVYNLLGNAISHVGDDCVVIVRQEVKGDTVRVSVIDHGEGVPQEDRELIWKRYYQVRRADGARHALNSGLGLSIVHTLITLHGGRCGVDANEPQGSTFWFELPVTES